MDVNYEALYSQFVIDCQKLDISEEILFLLANKKREFTRVLRTDNMDSFTRFTLPANPQCLSAFDRIDNSYELGELKLDRGGEYFLETANEYGVDISNCILIDDSRKNCDVFESLGGKTFCVSGINSVLNVILSIETQL